MVTSTAGKSAVSGILCVGLILKRRSKSALSSEHPKSDVHAWPILKIIFFLYFIQFDLKMSGSLPKIRLRVALESEGVHNSACRNASRKKVWSLIQTGANQKPSVWTAQNCQFFFGRIFLINQILSSADKVIVRILFFILDTIWMPVLTIFATSSDVSNTEDSLEVWKPRKSNRRKTGQKGYIETTVTV